MLWIRTSSEMFNSPWSKITLSCRFRFQGSALHHMQLNFIVCAVSACCGSSVLAHCRVDLEYCTVCKNTRKEINQPEQVLQISEEKKWWSRRGRNCDYFGIVMLSFPFCLFPFRKGKLVSSLKEIQFARQEERRTRNPLIIHQECRYLELRLFFSFLMF